MPGIRRLANESDRFTAVQARLRRMLKSGRCADRSASEVSNLACVGQRHRVEFVSRYSARRSHRPTYRSEGGTESTPGHFDEGRSGQDGSPSPADIVWRKTAPAPCG